jgi:hypothetical protein
MYKYSLPKIWTARIQKYWDKIMPDIYPVSDSTFSFKFDTEEETEAVVEFEENLESEESVVTEALPENTAVANYYGTYNVESTPGVRTLLSPEKVDSENVLAFHYNTEEQQWENIEDAEVVDGYVWGTLESFSPVALVEYRKEIHVEESVPGLKEQITSIVVCEGNPVDVTRTEEGKGLITNLTTGKTIEVDKASYVIGGSADGSYVEKTSVYIHDMTTNDKICKVIGGSWYVGDLSNPEDKSFAVVGEVNVKCYDKVAGCVTGSYGAVRTNKLNYDFKNCVFSWVGSGEGYKNVNTSNPDIGSRAIVKEVNVSFENVRSNLTFLGGNCEYFYVDSINANVVGGTHAYLIMGGSNSRTNKSVLKVADANVDIFQTTNRGDVAEADVKFTNCHVNNLFVGGDATDSTVTGTTGSIKVEVNAGDGVYNIQNGTEAGELLTVADIDRIVKYVKVSRNAGEVTIDSDYQAILKDKYIIK